eukprot:1159596-Pelagomonas_calceolata.AAC.13
MAAAAAAAVAAAKRLMGHPQQHSACRLALAFRGFQEAQLYGDTANKRAALHNRSAGGESVLELCAKGLGQFAVHREL